MERRRFLALVGGGSTLLAGCSGISGDTNSSTPTPTETATPSGSEDLPDGIYVQRFSETMSMQGMQTAGPYRVGFMYAAPHAFWNVNGRDLSKTERNGDIHGMAVVFHEPTGTVIPETGLSVEIDQDDELVSQEVIYPMLSQRMGYHYGANFGLDGDGEYTAKVSVGAIPDAVALTGEYAGQFREPATAEIPFAFTEEERAKVQVEELDAYGQPGAVKPMEMGMMPQATAPPKEDLPGTVLGEPLADDARLTTTVLEGESASRFDASTYLAVSARTRYNRLVLPAMALNATVRRDGETVYDGALTRTLDPDLDFHYGAGLDALASGDEVTLSVSTPPQVARHEGYERAFLQMDDVTLTV
ncbi:DUF7350 domain-containing protein [Halorarius litoreus]|uniref:DUF7350 domain-containing protein n=1 Tax=Halorarius litoreus TaxID=2962676 RepID=UPI0020CB98B6|nr:fe2+ transport protein [Halorarius litoreus]